MSGGDDLVWVESMCEHRYADKLRAVGVRYEAERKFLPVLERLGWARPVPPKTFLRRVNGKQRSARR